MIVIMKQGCHPYPGGQCHGPHRTRWAARPISLREKNVPSSASLAMAVPWIVSSFRRLDGVEQVVAVLRPFKLASRDFHPHDSVVPINGVSVGDKESL